jgi:hypothetical protein
VHWFNEQRLHRHCDEVPPAESISVTVTRRYDIEWKLIERVNDASVPEAAKRLGISRVFA